MADGRFALITGGAQGMGFAAAKRFLSDGFGGVLLLDRNAEKLADAAQRLKGLGRIETLAGDLLDVSLGGRAVATAVKAFGRLDVLVNAAGNTERCGLDDTTPESYERLFGVKIERHIEKVILVVVFMSLLPAIIGYWRTRRERRQTSSS